MRRCSSKQTLYCGKGHPSSGAPTKRSRWPTSPASISSIAAMAAASERAARGGVSGDGDGQQHGAAATLILSGRYIGYLPTHCAAPWVERRLMRSLLPARLAYESLFELITRKGVERTPALQAFLEDLQAVHPATAAAPRRQRPRRSAARALSRAAAAS
jgi:DNA-binding transcriptional LysR family regulator